MSKIRFAIPKGSLERNTYLLLEQSGYRISGLERSYRPLINDPDISLKILRPQEIPIYISEGLIDIGITGTDWIAEVNAEVKILLRLDYGFVKLVLAIPKEYGHVGTLSELVREFNRLGRRLRISTEYLNLTCKYLMNNDEYLKLYGLQEPVTITPWWRKGSNVMVNVILSFGATEAKPPEDADAIVDVVETGITLIQNNLKPIEVLMESCAVLISNKESLKDSIKREKIYDILALIKGVIDGRRRIHVFMNVKEENLNNILSVIPALKSPTISPLSLKGWYAINTVIDKDEFLKILPLIRKFAQGIVVHEPRQVLSLDEVL
ncbi:MAG: ATP phosphoribosyltransferase [Candidatus Methanomethylicia archaeon]